MPRYGATKLNAMVGRCFGRLTVTAVADVPRRRLYIRRMHGKRFLVVGYDPDSRYPWHSQQGSRGTRGEAAENWIAVTLRTPEEMDRVVQQMSLLPQTRVEPAKK